MLSCCSSYYDGGLQGCSPLGLRGLDLEGHVRTVALVGESQSRTNGLVWQHCECQLGWWRHSDLYAHRNEKVTRYFFCVVSNPMGPDFSRVQTFIMRRIIHQAEMSGMESSLRREPYL